LRGQSRDRRYNIAAMKHTALSRRELLALMAAGIALPALDAQAAATRAADWNWLLGSWDVWHSRLKDRLVNSKEWQEFAGKSAFWSTMGGLGNCDDNSLDLPAGVYRGLSVRAYDPGAGSWAIWWLDGRNPERIDPPVRGGFKGDEGEFIGTDTYKGTPVTVRFRWHEVNGKRPWWDQAFSTDCGKTWEINWRNYFTRTNPQGVPLPRIGNDPPEARAWDFLAGKWKVHNRRLRARFVGSKDWDEFDSTLNNWQVLGGRGNVGDNLFNGPGTAYRGMSLRAYNDERKEWLSWWLDGRRPQDIGAPLRGRFEGATATLVGDDELDGKPVKLRSVWARTDTESPRWEQAASLDGGKSWETNWVAELARA
jgi:hypothetical protein